jgi:hypothetical protein
MFCVTRPLAFVARAFSLAAAPAKATLILVAPPINHGA